MIEPKQIFRIDRPDKMYPFGLRLKMALRYDNGDLALAQPVEMKVVTAIERGMGMAQDTLPMISDITTQGAQCLMDELWNAGVRPSDIGTAGHLGATQQHLGDMRALVKHFTNAELPKYASDR